ncbi:MAG: DMT family transporter [Thalassobaculum sp.]|uniref:DMT family transporter n=1 Tax=Thalassobaculum sp. TaxID=2022740 RepID=UPI0032F052D6
MAALSAEAPSTAGYGRGIAMQVIAVAMFASMGMVIKLLDGRYPTSQIILFRCAPALLPLILYLPLQGGWSALKTRRPGWHLVRTVAGIGSMYVGFYALGRMAFADYVAISFTAPLFGTLLSIPFLGERVGIWRTGAVGLGFAGALLTAGPIAGEFDPMVLFAVGSAFGYGMAMIAMRKLGSTDKSSATVFYFTVAGALSSLLLLPAQWVAPTPEDLALLVTIGLVGGVAQIFMTEAFRLAPPSVVAPFDYTAMLWALAFGFFVFGTFPGPQVLAGAALICASGLFIIHRETVRGVKRAKLKSSSL